MKIQHGDFTIELLQEHPDHNPASADNVRRYDHCRRLGDYCASAHGVLVLKDTTIQANTIILAGGGATGIHEHSALTAENALFLAAGAYVVRLVLPSLEIDWAIATDPASCFGIHPVPGSTDFISHGELEIARVTPSGTILWRNGGPDIFTGHLIVTPASVIVTDFNDDRFCFDLLTGNPQSPPHTPSS